MGPEPQDSMTLKGRAIQRAMLRSFLRSRRARLSPEEFGLPSAGRRNTPGLRREEIADLAGVSVSWYTWLEQGRDIKVSNAVLDAISTAMRLSHGERRHLYQLAGVNPPAMPDLIGCEADQLTQIVEGWRSDPAYVLDRHWTVVATNTAAQILLGLRIGRNHFSDFFLDPVSRGRHPRWHEVAIQWIGRFRGQAARFPGDPRFAEIVDELASASRIFRELWQRHEIPDEKNAILEIRQTGSEIGLLERIVLGIREHNDVSLVVCVPAVA